MKVHLVLLLCACSVACAELPPVVDKTGGVSADAAMNVAKQPPAVLTTSYEMMKRIEQMQKEVQQLTGKVEEQAFLIEELKKQQKTMYTDFDDRLQSIENKPAVGTGQPPADIPADPLAPSGPGASSTDSPPAPASLPATQDNPANTVEPLSSAPAQAAQISDANSTQVSGAEEQEYQQAYDDLRNGRTDKAITGFNTYIANHSGSSYASNSQYWLGEAYRVNQDNAAARKAFNAVLDSYPNSAKVPDALLKLGYIEMEEKNMSKAREIFNRIKTEFSDSKAAVLAQQKLLKLDSNL